MLSLCLLSRFSGRQVIFAARQCREILVIELCCRFDSVSLLSCWSLSSSLKGSFSGLSAPGEASTSSQSATLGPKWGDSSLSLLLLLFPCIPCLLMSFTYSPSLFVHLCSLGTFPPPRIWALSCGVANCKTEVGLKDQLHMILHLWKCWCSYFTQHNMVSQQQQPLFNPTANSSMSGMQKEAFMFVVVVAIITMLLSLR